MYGDVRAVLRAAGLSEVVVAGDVTEGASVAGDEILDVFVGGDLTGGLRNRGSCKAWVEGHLRGEVWTGKPATELRVLGDCNAAIRPTEKPALLYLEVGGFMPYSLLEATGAVGYTQFNASIGASDRAAGLFPDEAATKNLKQHRSFNRWSSVTWPTRPGHRRASRRTLRCTGHEPQHWLGWVTVVVRLVPVTLTFGHPSWPWPHRTALEYGALGETLMKALAVGVSLVFTLISLSLLRGDDRKVDPDKLPPPAADTMDFVKDIKPILERSCVRCHSDPKIPRNQAPNKGGLNLESREAALKGGATGAVIVPGKSAESRLIHLVSGFPDGDVRAMPPREAARLSRVEIGKLRAWIDQGAIWPNDK